MFQYFLKVVSTKFDFLDGRELNTHQYSVTSYERDLSTGATGTKDAEGHQTSHGYAGVPGQSLPLPLLLLALTQAGLFFNYEISPLMVIHRETRQSFAHFLTSTCAIVGGVLTVAGLIDSFVYAGRNRILKGGGAVKEGLGYGARQGKFL